MLHGSAGVHTFMTLRYMARLYGQVCLWICLVGVVLAEDMLQRHAHEKVQFSLEGKGELECYCRHMAPVDVQQEEDCTEGTEDARHHCFETCMQHQCRSKYRHGAWDDWYTCLSGCRSSCFDVAPSSAPPAHDPCSGSYEDAIDPACRPAPAPSGSELPVEDVRTIIQTALAEGDGVRVSAE